MFDFTAEPIKLLLAAIIAMALLALIIAILTSLRSGMGV